jgi:hypothetical protein
MSESKIDFSRFTLPFISECDSETADDGADGADEDEPPAKEDVREEMESRIPSNAIFIGSTSDTVENWTTWEVDDHYYVIPWQGPEFDWAMFRISWDDNWGRYEWSCDARISDVPDGKVAAREMFTAVMARWGIDLDDSENASYREFLEDI